MLLVLDLTLIIVFINLQLIFKVLIFICTPDEGLKPKRCVGHFI